MLCDNCKKKIAKVHMTKIINGIKEEINLCEECAKKSGSIKFDNSMEIVAPFSVQSILSGILDYMNNSENLEKKYDEKCECCGTTYSQFKDNGLVGCSECYTSFKTYLFPIIRRIQGNIEHTGKIPIRTGEILRKKRKINKLQKELQQCISEEKYERAAEIRDNIKSLKEDK